MEQQVTHETAPAAPIAPAPLTGALALERLLARRWQVTAAAARSAERRRPLRPLLGPLRRARGAADRLWLARRMRRLDGAGRLLGAQRIVRSLPSFRGTFELDLRSDVTRSLLCGGFEGQLVPILEEAISGGDVIDVGANAGLYAVLAARLLGGRGRVLAVEPAPSVLPLLHANLRRNGLDDVIVFEGAVAAEPGQLTLHMMEGNEEYASLGGHHHPHAPRRQERRVTVPTETLDNLVERYGLRPTFLKIDTEGAEGLVLRGAARTLRAQRPIILSELDDRLLEPLGWSAAQVLQLLQGAGYRAYDAYSGAALPAGQPAPFIGEIVAIPDGAAAPPADPQ